jgi:hypothetical protein
MHPRSTTALTTRLACGIAAVLATAALAGPAFAEDPSPSPTGTPSPTPSATSSPAASPKPNAPGAKADLSVSYPWLRNVLMLAPHTSGKPVTPAITNNGKGTATDVTVTIDYSKLTSAVSVLSLPDESDGCSADGDAVTCKLGDIEPGTSIRPPAITLKPAKDAKQTAAGVISATVHGGNTADARDAFMVVIEDSGVDLVAAARDVFAAPGESVAGDFAFFNDGDTVIPSIGFRVGAQRHINVSTKNENCKDDGDQLYCVVEDINLAPDELIIVDDINLTVSKRAPGPNSYHGEIAGAPLTGATNPQLRALAAKPARKPLHVTRTKVRKTILDWIPDLNEGDNVDGFAISTSANPADLQAVAGNIAGPRNEKLAVKFSVKNNGPADIDELNDDWSARTTITAPSGTELSTGDQQCETVTPKRVFHCRPSGPIPPGTTTSWAFTATITSATPGSGSITVDGGKFDTTPANNKAPIAVSVIAAGGGGSLPVTGAAVGGFLAAGAVLLGLGTLLVIAGRRRRSVS